MSRRRPRSGATISLFPFLAVLLCTMGALLVLLVIFSRRASEADTAAACAAEAARVEELELARDELSWRLDQLRCVREQTAADLARERMRLAGVEEDARRLADELDELERTAEALESADPGADVAAAVAAAERRLAAARSALDEARAAGADRPPAYAVVPYEGTNGTHRRPLYVECCIDGVFLQPEGIRLGPADFEGPPGPGNPLASGLRAAREHLAGGPGESGDPAVQPYPLLLVRPSGVMAYYAAREALVSWGSEFGYQFIDEDWQLTYPPADPALAAAEQRAVDESRRRMEWLAQARPARPAKPTRQYRASTTRGGVEAEGGPTVLGDQSRFDWTEEQAGGGPRRGGAEGRSVGTEEGPGGGDVVLGGGGGAGGSGPGGAAADRYAGPSRFYSGQPTADAATAAGSMPGGVGGPQGTGGVTGRADATAGAGNSTLRGSASSGGAGEAPAGGAGNTAGSGAAAAGGGGSAAGSPGLAAAPAGAAAGGTSGGPALPGMAQGGGAAVSVGAAGSASLAGARGSNWASLATAERPIPLTRPIRIECAAQEFRLLDEAGSRVETRIPIGTRTEDSVDPLVRAVHGRVARWGLAGERMYWRPELVLSETDDGRSRREDLERLLADSGIDTRRGEADRQVRPLPPVTRVTTAPQRR